MLKFGSKSIQQFHYCTTVFEEPSAAFSAPDILIYLNKLSDTEKLHKMSILNFPSEIFVEIATYLGTIRNLANFKMTCSQIYNAIESEKVDRKRLPHLKIRHILFGYIIGAPDMKINYKQKREASPEKRCWNHSDPFGTKLRILMQHWILEDDCQITLYGPAILSIPLLKSLSEISYGNVIQCEFFDGSSDPGKFQEASPFIHEFLKKVFLILHYKTYNHFKFFNTVFLLIEPPVGAIIVSEVRRPATIGGGGGGL